MKKVYIIIFSLLASGFIFFAVEGTSKAAEWPGNEWGPGTDMEIMLSKNKNHKSDRGTRVKFAYYAKNNQGQKRITFVKTICGSKQGSQATARSGVNVVSFSNGSCGNKQLNLGNGSNMIISGVNYTKYEISVELATGANADQDDPWNNPNLAVFRFGVDYDDSNGNFVGYLKDGTTSLPINSRLNNNEDYLPSDLRIKVACNIGSVNGIINFYDSDNNKDLYAQPENGYTPVKYKITDTILEHTDSKPNGWGYNVNNNFWWPIDTTSSSLRTARVAIPSDSKDRYFVIRSLGQGNYTILDLPFDETRPKCDPPPKCPAPYDYLSPPLCPPQPRFNWAVVPSASVDKNIALLGETVNFTQTQSRATGFGGWISDVYTSDRVEATIITTKDGNIINSTDFHTDAGGVIAKSNSENITMNQTGVYCQYINYPVGFLGKRKTPNYRSTGYTYRWVFIPGRAGNMTQYNPVGDPATGGYGQWWLASTTDDTPDNDNSNGFNQYWAFHNWQSIPIDNAGSVRYGQDGGSGIWRWYSPDNPPVTDDSQRRPWEVYGWWNPSGSYNNFNYDGPKECVTVINPTPESTANDYEKNIVDHEINHSVSLGVNPCPVFSTPVDIEARGEDGVVFYDQTVTASFGGSNCTWNFSPVKKIPYAQLNDKPPGYSVTYSTILGFNGKPSIKSFRVFEVPFARFYGNDIYSQNGIDFNTVSSDIKKGSVTQYAAMAVSEPAIGTGVFNYGTNSELRAVNQSIPNPVPFVLPQICSNTVSTDLSTIATKSCFKTDANISFNNSTTYNSKISIESSGNIYIDGDITNATPIANYSDPKNTGVLLIRARNIYISPNVKRIDAILFASQSVVTCTSNINGDMPQKNNWHKIPTEGGCRNPLTINGAIQSSDIKFARTGGSRFLNNGSMNSADTSYNISARNDAGYASGEPAEVVNFPTYLYFARPYLEDTSNNTFGSMYDAPPRR